MVAIVVVGVIFAVSALLLGGVREMGPMALAFAAVTVLVIGMGWVHP